MNFKNGQFLTFKACVWSMMPLHLMEISIQTFLNIFHACHFQDFSLIHICFRDNSYFYEIRIN